MFVLKIGSFSESEDDSLVTKCSSTHLSNLHIIIALVPVSFSV